MNDATPIEWTCPRCGSVFSANAPCRLGEPRETGTPVEQFAHHAERDHDLDEQEILGLMAAVARVEATRLREDSSSR